MIPSTPVSVRLPNSMIGWKDISPWNSGVKDPGSHIGHCEQPRPEPVSRTAPPVTMMPIWAMRLAMARRHVRRSTSRLRSGPAGTRDAAAGGVADAGRGLVEVTLLGYVARPHRCCRRGGEGRGREVRETSP